MQYKMSSETATKRMTAYVTTNAHCKLCYLTNLPINQFITYSTIVLLMQLTFKYNLYNLHVILLNR